MYYENDNPHGGDVYGKNIRIDFSANVNPFGTPKPVIDAAADALKDTALYPDPYCRDLIKALAKREGLSEKMIYAGSGAAELIYSFCLAAKFKTALIVCPTFLEYASALGSAGTKIVPYICGKENGFRPDEKLPEYIFREKPDAVFICNPNNPTGASVSLDLMKEIHGSVSRTGGMLFVDECFYELSDGKITMKDEIPGHDDLFILRAFTKSFALASLRLGYCLCSNGGLLKKMSAVTPPWSISGPAQAAGKAALSETDFLEESREKIRIEREWFAKELSRCGLRVWPSEVNYLFIEAEPDLQEKLRRRGIEIRSCENYAGLSKGYFRIAVRRHEENMAFLFALKQIYDSPAKSMVSETVLARVEENILGAPQHEDEVGCCVPVARV